MLGGKQVETACAGSAHAWPVPGAPADPFADYAFLLNGTIDRTTLARGVALGARWGVSPHEALIATGWLSSEAYARALAEYCGVGFIPPEQRHHLMPPSPMLRPRDCLRTGVLKLRGPRAKAVLPADGRNPTVLKFALAGFDERVLAFAPQPALRAAICRHFQRAFQAHAAEGLHRRDPERSAKAPLPRWMIAVLAVTMIAVATGLALSFSDTIRALSLLMAAAFLPIAGLRVAALWHFACRRERRPEPIPRMPDTTLPVYTLLVPLLREAAVVRRLTEALKRLDYPALRIKRTKA